MTAMQFAKEYHAAMRPMFGDYIPEETSEPGEVEIWMDADDIRCIFTVDRQGVCTLAFESEESKAACFCTCIEELVRWTGPTLVELGKQIANRRNK